MFNLICWFQGKKDQQMPVIKLGGPKKFSHLKKWASELPTGLEHGQATIFVW